MSKKKSTKNGKKAAPKKALHPRNVHQGRYDFDVLTATLPELKPFVALNEYGNISIDFANFEAVKMLNKALLLQYYGIKHWDIPDGYLCPPIPGRADYVHYIADFLAKQNKGELPRGKSVRVLDIGVGANAIYPIIGHKSYGWSFVGTDVDKLALRTVDAITKANHFPKNAVECRLQSKPSYIISGMIGEGETFDITMCNPPFHASLEDAEASTKRKWKNLKQDAKPSEANAKKARAKEVASKVHLNFGGKNNELCYPGGELAFIEKMIHESANMRKASRFFSTLVSKQSNLKKINHALTRTNPRVMETIEMGQGQKVSRLVVWGY